MDTVIYHGGGCRDGFCAAWLANRKRPDASFVAANYGDDPPCVVDEDVLIVDFSYPLDTMRQIITDAKNVTVLDHHKTAEKALLPLIVDDQAIIVFDMEKSGAHLMWEFLQTEEIDDPHWLIPYTEDRDLWKWELPNSKAINAALASYPLDFQIWDELAFLYPDSFIEQGEAILRYQDTIIDSHVANASEIPLGGYVVLAVNATTLISEIAGKLAEGRPFGCCWFDKADGGRVYSLRSKPDGLDVSEIAKQFGGGGHKHAAGFTRKPNAILFENH